jgi:hypothetical protein
MRRFDLDFLLLKCREFLEIEKNEKGKHHEYHEILAGPIGIELRQKFCKWRHFITLISRNCSERIRSSV